MERRYRYWIFYVRKDKMSEIADALGVDADTRIYAYTDSKEKADEFEKYRDMDLFIRRKVKMTSAEVRDITLKYRNLYIICTKLTSISSDREKVIEVPLAVTMMEQKILELELMGVSAKILFSTKTVPPTIFKHDIFNALNIIKYVAIHMEQMGVCCVQDLSQLHVVLDEFYVFLSIFGDTMRK